MIDLSALEKTSSEPEDAYKVAQALAVQYLKETAWYFIRFLETQVPVPKDIAAKRAEAYEVLNKEHQNAIV